MNKEKVVINTGDSGNPEASLLIIYTGGTLGMAYDKKGALVSFDFQQIRDKIPSLCRFNLLLTVISFENLIDSAEATPGTWVQIGDIIFNNYNNYDGFVVLHGTDTMAYSASALSFMLRGLQKPVIFTGAQLPIGAIRTDARENLLAALEIASAKKEDGTAVVPEVCIYFNYRLLRGNRARKVQSIHFDAFESDNYPLLAEAGVEILYNRQSVKEALAGDKLQYFRKFNEQTGLLKIFPGMSRVFTETLLSSEGLKGIVLETFGSGTAPSFPWFRKAIEKATEAGVVILNVSQCNGGKVMQDRYETGKWLARTGVLSGADITTEAALAKMMILFGEDLPLNELRNYLTIPLSGEMTLN